MYVEQQKAKMEIEKTGMKILSSRKRIDGHANQTSAVRL